MPVMEKNWPVDTFRYFNDSYWESIFVYCGKPRSIKDGPYIILTFDPCIFSGKYFLFAKCFKVEGCRFRARKNTINQITISFTYSQIRKIFI